MGDDATGGRPKADIEPSVLAVAREGEPDRYAAALLAPDGLVADLVALAAFAAEIARVPAQVREPMMGEIRLQWWHDALALPGDSGLSGHPVADALRRAVRRHGLDPAPLDAMIEARLTDVGRELFADDAALMAYFEASEGNAFKVALAMAGVPMSPDVEVAAMAGGRAYGLARALGRLPLSLRHGAFPIPAARLAAEGLGPAALTEQPVSPELAAKIAAISADLRQVAIRDLSDARTALAALGQQALAPMLPLAMVEPHFAVQERRRGAALDRIAEPSPLRRFWRLWRASRARRV